MDNEIDGDMEELPRQPRVDVPESDLILLQRAAHAIGAVRFEVVVGEGYVNLHFANGSVVHSWNPLMFSGDAFELIAKLQMQVDYFARGHQETGGVNVQCGPNILIYEPKLGDVADATRRAVTRAAGEMANERPTSARPEPPSHGLSDLNPSTISLFPIFTSKQAA